jgi:tRNA uridine 5-carbamoylmethylation protein Kti12
MRNDPEAVLITGMFGSGKSSVAVEMADVLEKRGIRYAVLDLDWLAWASTADDEEGAEHRLLLKNLEPVVGNYLAAGVRLFILARSVRASELESLRAGLAMPMRVVRLTVPWAEIERRLGADVTAARQDDLRDAAAWNAASEGVGIEDMTVPNDRPVREVAMEVLDRLGWT